MVNNFIFVEVAYAVPAQQVIISLQVEPETTVVQAIQQSGILQQFPEINLQRNKVGIFGEIVSLDNLLQAGDRVEIYRALSMDPKLARRLRAEKQKRNRSK